VPGRGKPLSKRDERLYVPPGAGRQKRQVHDTAYHGAN
jgi:hypothetical protein